MGEPLELTKTDGGGESDPDDPVDPPTEWAGGEGKGLWPRAVTDPVAVPATPPDPVEEIGRKIIGV